MAEKLFGFQHRFGGDDPYDYSSIKSLEEFKTLVADVTVIAFVDINGKGDGVIFGREIINAIGQRAIPPQEVCMMVFAIDHHSTQFEHLLAAIQITKGFHEYYHPDQRITQ